MSNEERSTASEVLVIGAGSWGTALALVLARNNNQVILWDKDSAHIKTLQSEGCNRRHLPDHDFPDSLRPVTDFIPLPDGICDIVIVTPSQALTEVLHQLETAGRRDFAVCLACKGIEQDSLSLNHELVGRILGKVPVAVLSGPSFANEVAGALPTAVTIASTDDKTALRFVSRFNSETFRVYTSNDVIGVQIGGAVKNVMAIAAGISDGLGFGANARSALITRGLYEIMHLGKAMGGQQETFMGLTGLGDLVLTCTDNQSRNRRFGLALAAGRDPEDARKEIGQAVEGIHTAEVVLRLAEKYRIEMPISGQVYRIIRGEIAVRDAVHELLSRRPGTEQ